jgi:hypothetical protein
MPGAALTGVAESGSMGHITAPCRLPDAQARVPAPAGGAMTATVSGTAERAKAERIRSLAQRCRDLSELTAIPEVTRELVSIAEALDSEAELVADR